jgi:hypothetical protein
VSWKCHFRVIFLEEGGKNSQVGRTSYKQETEETNGGLPLVGPASAGASC